MFNIFNSVNKSGGSKEALKAMAEIADDFDLGQRLRGLRELHGLSQRELAKRAGVSNAVISLIEQNRNNPSVGMLKKVLAGFPLSLADFFALDLAPREQVFYQAEELTEIAGGKVSYRQVGPGRIAFVQDLQAASREIEADLAVGDLAASRGRGRWRGD